MIDIKSIWANQKPTGEIILKTRIYEIRHFSCYAATNHITGQHLFIFSFSKNTVIPELKNFKFKGVGIFSVELSDTNELHIYLLDNELLDIFILFIQNILIDVKESVTEKEAVTACLNIISKWKKLFDKITYTGLSIEQQKGLFGELMFLLSLIREGKPIGNILNSWTGADFESKDFTFGTIGIEVKMSTSKHPKVNISNENQLDTQNLSSLFLILYIMEVAKDNAYSLNMLIEEIRSLLDTDYEMILFNQKLLSVGFRDEDADHYNTLYSLKKEYCFEVEHDFPRIIKSSIPLGIYNTTYSIEISSIEKYLTEVENIKNKI